MKIIERQWQRYEADVAESDTAGFLSLMYVGEALIKTLTCALLGAVEDDQGSTRYQLAYRLVRADGIGEWVAVLGELSKGPASNLLPTALGSTRTALAQRVDAEQWQAICHTAMSAAATELGLTPQNQTAKVELRATLELFVQIRNKTRGHGATQVDDMSRASVHLKNALLHLENIPIFKTSWAYLKQNISGKYRVSSISDTSSNFNYLTVAASTQKLEDGIYYWGGKPLKAALIESTPDLVDFFFPNGNFRNEKYETLSYITSSRKEIEASKYNRQPMQLPASETEGLSELQVTGESFTNLPNGAPNYVGRIDLEKDLTKILSDDRHPVITLHGMGGIGKTSLAIKVLRDLADLGEYEVIVWLSARDIDLLDHGVKPVRPSILSLEDVAKELYRLVNPLLPEMARRTGKQCLLDLTEILGDKSVSKPRLFVLDNFETVKNPVEVFTALSDCIRLPNKLLITSRFREFRADYPLEVRGMQLPEARELISGVAAKLGITSIIDEEYFLDLYQSAGGHPYIMKVALGEASKRNAPTQVSQILIRQGDLLEALFQRAYASLSLLGQRLFLLISSWSSLIPRLAIETVVLVSLEEISNLDGAIDELIRTSLIDETKTGDFDMLFAPIAAKQFAKQQLKTSQLGPQVREDLTVLQTMGTTTAQENSTGIEKRLQKLAFNMLHAIDTKRVAAEQILPALEYMSKYYSSTRFRLATWFEEHGEIDKALSAAELFLQSSDADPKNTLNSWDLIIRCKKQTGDSLGELNALCKKALVPEIDRFEFSNTVNSINQIFASTEAPTAHRRALLNDVCTAYETRFSQSDFDATDFSRIAWLYLHVHRTDAAKKTLDRGLQLEPENSYCYKLTIKLGGTRGSRNQI
ncbi:NB-ARC domain-containing protein [Variovorax sp. VaC1]|uniref:NB-ARC domain-containing protein n=1 Tax=Variovorax sp. VaC1 TaxID=3373132 RepID=UPI0037480017